VLTTEAYSRADVRRILKITEKRLRSWERHGLCEVRTEFGFADLLALKTLQKLRQNRVPADRIKHSLAALRTKLEDVERPLWELKIVSNGRRVAVELPKGRMEALTGQMLFKFEADSLKSVETLTPTSPKGTAQSLHEAELWFRRGLEMEESGAPAREAIEAYERALESNPKAAGAWVNIGTLRYRQGDLDRAEYCYRQALKISPNYALAHFNLGNICDERDRLPEAVNHYKIALGLQDSYADAHYNLALAYERMGEPMRAAKHWRAYLKLDSSSPWASIAHQQLHSLLTITPGGRSQSGATGAATTPPSRH